MTERNQPIEKYSDHFRKIESRYGAVSEQSLMFHTTSLDHQLNEVVQNGTFVDYQENARQAGGLMDYAISANQPEVSKILRYSYAHGLSALALKIVSSEDEEKGNLQKQKELLWIHGVAQKIRNRSVQHLTEAMIDDLPLSPKEKLIKLKENTEFSVRRYINEKKDAYKKWKESPTAQKIKAPAEFALTMALSIVAAEKLPEMINTENIMKVHATTIGMRGLVELSRQGVRLVEIRHPKFAALSEKLASKKAVQATFAGLEKLGLKTYGEIVSLSDMLKETGHLITQIQTSAPVLGLTAGTLLQNSFEHLHSLNALNENHNQINDRPETLVATETHEPTKVTKTLHPTITPTPEATTENVLNPRTSDSAVTVPNIEPKLPICNSINNDFVEPSAQISSIPVNYSAHTLGHNETFTELVKNLGVDPYGAESSRILLDTVELPQQLADYLNAGGTIRDIMNGNAAHDPHFQQLNRLLTKAWTFKPGTEILLPDS